MLYYNISLMKNFLFIGAFLYFLLIYFPFEVYGQNSVSISGTNTGSIQMTAPLIPGSPVETVIDESKWLNYNISVAPDDPSVSISVHIASGALPNGLRLQLQAGSFQGTGEGGITSGNLTLSNIPQVLISNIRRCNTGTGINFGHQLTYRYTISDYSAVIASNSSLEILFTINTD